MADIHLGNTNVGNTERVTFTIYKDEVPWDVTSATVTFRFKRPNKTTFDRAAVIGNGPAGVVYYDTVDGDFDVPGQWAVSVLVVDGIVSKRYPNAIIISVESRP